MVDIDLIDARGINGGNRPRDGMLPNQRRQLFALLNRKQF